MSITPKSERNWESLTSQWRMIPFEESRLDFIFNKLLPSRDLMRNVDTRK